MGGGLFAVIAIWGLITGRAVPVNIGYLALAVTFIWAGFRAWRKEVQGGAHLRVALDSALQSSDANGDQPGRIFTDEVPSFLIHLSDGRTSVQTKKLIEPYLGKWGRLLNLTVDDVQEITSGHTVSGLSADGAHVIMYFKEGWTEQVLILRRGSKINIVGQIGVVDSLYVRFENCEILRHSKSALSPATHI